jgi:hypothetical protein
VRGWLHETWSARPGSNYSEAALPPPQLGNIPSENRETRPNELISLTNRSGSANIVVRVPVPLRRFQAVLEGSSRSLESGPTVIEASSEALEQAASAGCPLLIGATPALLSMRGFAKRNELGAKSPPAHKSQQTRKQRYAKGGQGGDSGNDLERRDRSLGDRGKKGIVGSQEAESPHGPSGERRIHEIARVRESRECGIRKTHPHQNATETVESITDSRETPLIPKGGGRNIAIPDPNCSSGYRYGAPKDERVDRRGASADRFRCAEG